MCSAHGEHPPNPLCNRKSSHQVRNCWVPTSFDAGSHWGIHGVSRSYQVKTSYWKHFYVELFTRYLNLSKPNRMGTGSSNCSVIVRWTPYSKIVVLGWIKLWTFSEYGPDFISSEEIEHIPSGQHLQCNLQWYKWDEERGRDHAQGIAWIDLNTFWCQYNLRQVIGM